MDIMNCVNTEFLHVLCTAVAIFSGLSTGVWALATYIKWVADKGGMQTSIIMLTSSAALCAFALAGSSAAGLFLTLAKCVA